MCGIAGFIDTSGKSPTTAWPAVLRGMGNSIRYRGPDGSGIWLDDQAGIGLIHRRLSVLDLSPAGHQPMASPSGRFVAVFNGEIYNHLELRENLHSLEAFRSLRWVGHSDTETLMAGFEAWGIEATLKKCQGMFAVAIWDRDSRTLTLARDRLGEKPLYYGWQGDAFLFGSELKALKAHPAFNAEIDRGALALFMAHNTVPAPYSIYQDIYKLSPGSLLTVSKLNRSARPQKYWDVCEVVTNGIAQPYRGSPDEAVDELERLLRDVVAQQMVADVSLGAFLSGGVDSSTIVALMQAQSASRVRTFTIGFNEACYNEAEHAKAVAKHLGTNHAELYISPQEALDLIPLLPHLYCEPFADSSQIPTFLVSQLARQHVTVSLSGDGGDELFCGYNRYLMAQRFWSNLSRVPFRLRRIFANMLTAVSPSLWNNFFGTFEGLFSSSFAQVNIGDKLHKGAEVMCAHSSDELYELLSTHWRQSSELVIGAVELPTLLNNIDQQPKTDHFIHRMMAVDMLTFLPDDILTKVDRAAMGVSLESRIPLLDHRVVEFAWGLPLSYKLRNGVGKWPLREVLYRYVPKKLIERPKMGFSVPIGDWLKGPLRDWAENLLNETRLEQEGYFNPAQIRQKWAEHLSGQRNWQAHLWNVLMFQIWLEANHK